MKIELCHRIVKAHSDRPVFTELPDDAVIDHVEFNDGCFCVVWYRYDDAELELRAIPN